MSPQRIQRQRAKGWRMPEGAVYVGRPSRFGNPFTVGREGTVARWDVWTVVDDTDRLWAKFLTEGAARAWAVELFALHIGPMGNYEYDTSMLAALELLAGRDLACWCALDQPCHADVLLELANGGAA